MSIRTEKFKSAQERQRYSVTEELAGLDINHLYYGSSDSTKKATKRKSRKNTVNTMNSYSITLDTTIHY